MKAIVQEGYGSPGVLALRDMPTPPIGDRGVLVEVRAASVNALDWHITRGMPFLVRLMAGLRSPKDNIRGVDVSGRVVAVGKDTTRFRAGDEVFGSADGSFAEYAPTKEDQLALKPPGITHEQAATLNIAGLTALQGLRDRARVQRGQHVLVNGAGGGVGTFAVQLAKWLGARVTAVTRTRSMDLVRSIGADDVIDHTAEDFTRRGERYDVIYDIGGTQPLNHHRRALTKTGALLTVGAPAGRWIAPASRLLAAAALSPFVSQRIVPMVAKTQPDDLALLAKLTEEGMLSPVIDRRYALSDTPAALRYLGDGSAIGKLVIAIH